MDSEVTSSDTATTGSGKPWRPLLLGVASLVAFPVVFVLLRAVMALLGGRDAFGGVSPAILSIVVSLALGVAGLVDGLRALVHHERSRRVWAGTLLSGLVAGAWTAFALAEAISPA